jgi:hypothetical protein
VQVNNGLTNTTVYSLAAKGADTFAGTASGVFLTNNNGNNWTVVDSGLTYLGIYALEVSDTSILAATNGGGVFISPNNGNYWDSMGIHGGYWALAVGGTDVYTSLIGYGILKSTNNGWGGWSAIYTGLSYSTSFVGCIAVKDSNIFAGTYGGVILSTNSGNSWNIINTGLTHDTILSLAISGANIFAGSTEGSVFLSNNNGASWSPVSIGLTTARVFSLAISGNNIFAGTNGGGVFLSTNNGSTWTAVNTGLTDINVLTLKIAGTNIFAGTNGGGVFISSLADITTGISENRFQEMNVNISPNPFTTQTTITFSSEQKNSTLYIRDVLGRMINGKRLLVNGKSVELDMSDVAKGIYFVEVKDEKGNSFNKKIVVQ